MGIFKYWLSPFEIYAVFLHETVTYGIIEVSYLDEFIPLISGGTFI